MKEILAYPPDCSYRWELHKRRLQGVKLEKLQDKVSAIKQMQNITDGVCELYDITYKEMKGSRRMEVMIPKQICQYLMREVYKIPLVMISRFFGYGKQGHASVINNVKKVEGYMTYSERVKEVVKCFTES